MLTQHPYFKGCFNTSGEVDYSFLVEDPFKVKSNFDDSELVPIPYEYLFRMENGKKSADYDFDIKGFTHMNHSQLSS
jgi:hypothetical protein